MQQTSYTFDALSPEAVRRRLDIVDLEEKAKLAEGLALIALMDARGDYLEAGYSCMQKYCMGRLGMSEEKATKRLVVARAGRRHAGVFERIADGRLSVSVMVVLSPRLTESTASVRLAAAERRPRREVQKLLAELDRTPSTPTPSEPPTAAERMDESAEPTPSLADLLGHDTGMTEPSPGKVKTHVRGRVFETEQGARGLRVELTEEEFADFTKVRDLLSHVIRNGDPAEVLARALSIAAAQLEKQRWGAKPGSAELKRTPKGRHIPKTLRRFVAERDGHCCSFTSPDGHRCGETRALQVNHIVADLRAALMSLGLTKEQSDIAVERPTHLALGRIEDRVLVSLKEHGKGLAA